ncbi:hypothetical protein [Herpetosiphon gulosus]|uniref:Adenylate kinase n=1 Tax=Herpetosiphon gulosus TaxID=1973496 RepID=A0ABP9X842_9CHLR
MPDEQFHVVYLTGAPATGKSSLTELIASTVAPVRVLTYSKLLDDYISKRQGNPLGENELRKRSAGLITPEDGIQKLSDDFFTVSNIIIGIPDTIIG